VTEAMDYRHAGVHAQKHTHLKQIFCPARNPQRGAYGTPYLDHAPSPVVVPLPRFRPIDIGSHPSLSVLCRSPLSVPPSLSSKSSSLVRHRLAASLLGLAPPQSAPLILRPAPVVGLLLLLPGAPGAPGGPPPVVAGVWPSVFGTSERRANIPFFSETEPPLGSGGGAKPPPPLPPTVGKGGRVPPGSGGRPPGRGGGAVLGGGVAPPPPGSGGGGATERGAEPGNGGGGAPPPPPAEPEPLPPGGTGGTGGTGGLTAKPPAGGGFIVNPPGGFIVNPPGLPGLGGGGAMPEGVAAATCPMLAFSTIRGVPGPPPWPGVKPGAGARGAMAGMPPPPGGGVGGGLPSGCTRWAGGGGGPPAPPPLGARAPLSARRRPSSRP